MKKRPVNLDERRRGKAPVVMLSADEIAVRAFEQMLEQALGRAASLPEALALLANHWSGPRTLDEAGI